VLLGPWRFLGWQLELLSLQYFSDVQIEEVTVQHSLHNSGDGCNDIVEALTVVPVHPVDDVQSPVRAKSEEVVRGDALRLACLGDHEQLGKDGDRFQVDAERPHDLHEGELVVDDNGQKRGRDQQELQAESVVVVVVGSLELHVHQVHRGERGHQVHHLHGCVINGDKVGEQVQVPRHKCHGE